MKVSTESNMGPKQIIPAGLFDIDTASFPTTTSVLVPIAQMKSFECLGYRASNIQHGGGVAQKDCPEPTVTLRRVFQLMHQSIDGLARVRSISHQRAFPAAARKVPVFLSKEQILLGIDTLPACRFPYRQPTTA